MKREKDETRTRRDFLKTGFAAVLAGTACFSFGGLKEALAAAKKADKALLTAETLNALIPDQPDDAYFKLCKEALNDPLAFLKKYFYLTPIQNEGLASLSESDWGQIKKGIQVALNKKYNFVVIVSSKRAGNSLNSDAEMVKANFTRMKWEVEVSAEGGTKGNGAFEGKVTVTAKATC